MADDRLTSKILVQVWSELLEKKRGTKLRHFPDTVVIPPELRERCEKAIETAKEFLAAVPAHERGWGVSGPAEVVALAMMLLTEEGIDVSDQKAFSE
jgi:hypothetical protein